MFALWTATLTLATLAAPQPNFIVLLADDLRYDCLSCAGHPVLQTPNIDGLARRGTRFANAFVSTSICCVSRASYWTGQYACHHGVGDFRTPLSNDGLQRSYALQLKRAGYRVGCLGKWGIGGPLPKESFDVWNAWSDQGKYINQVAGEAVHNSELLARWSVDFLDSQPKDKPFCLTVCFKAPHDPLEPDRRDAELFSAVEFPQPPSGTPAEFAKLPAFLQTSLGVQRARTDIPDDRRRQEYTRNYLRLVAGLDRAVGKIVAAMEKLGLASNTVVIFASDNGYMLGEHGMVHKWLMYEESIRVPLIIVDPTRSSLATRGRSCDAIALNVDVAPTILELAGLPILPRTDGVSLKRFLGANPPTGAPWREAFFYEHHYHHNQTIPRTEGLWTRDWKYVRYFDGNAAFEQLFDLRRDAIEVDNLATSERHAARLASMRQQYEKERSDTQLFRRAKQ